MKRSWVLIVLLISLLLPATLQASTCLQRFTAICNALLDGTASTEVKTRFGNSFVEENRQWIISQGIDPATITTTEQKACVVVKKIKEDFQAIANRKHIDVIEAKEAVVTAEVAIETAAATAATEAEADWPTESLE
jgi:hypothetical protein